LKFHKGQAARESLSSVLPESPSIQSALPKKPWLGVSIEGKFDDP